MFVTPIEAHTDTIKVRYTGSSFGLQKGQIYESKARLGWKNRFSDFKLIDGDGDVFTICKEDLGREFEMVEGELLE